MMWLPPLMTKNKEVKSWTNWSSS